MSRASSLNKSQQDQEVVFDLNIFKTKCKSVEENELENQAARVVYIFDKAIYKLKIISLLPRLLVCNGKFLRQYLPDKTVEFVLKTCSKYDPKDLEEDKEETSSSSDYSSELDLFETVLRDVKGKVQISHGMVLETRTSQLDIEVNQVIDEIFFCERLRYTLDHAFDKYEDVKTKTLIAFMETLKGAIHRQLILSAAKVKNYEIKLKQYYRENKETLSEIKNLQDILDKQRFELGSQIAERNKQIADCLNEIDELQRNIKKTFVELTKKAERTMVQKTTVSETRQVALSEHAKNAEESYRNLLETHLAEEKVLRIKQDKIEVQLSQWLAKYDQDIGDRQTVKEDLEAEFNKDKEELDKINELISEQEGLFDALMAEKEREEQEMNEQLAGEFRRNRAALIIQKAWKDYKFRKWMKKMARKAKKAKKAEEKPLLDTPIEIDTTGLFDDLPGGDTAEAT